MGAFIESKFGNSLLLDKEGHVYKTNCRDRIGRKIYWICREYEKQGKAGIEPGSRCTARATTDGIYVKNWKGPHNHPPVTEAHLQDYSFGKTGTYHPKYKPRSNKPRPDRV